MRTLFSMSESPAIANAPEGGTPVPRRRLRRRPPRLADGVPQEVRRIAEKAAELGLTGKELCRAAGVARSTWTRAVKGHHSPTLSTLERLGRVLRQAEENG